MRSPSWVLSIAGLEMSFQDGKRLSDIQMYNNFVAENPGEVAVPSGKLPAVWLDFPELDIEQDDVFSADAPVSVVSDLSRGLLSVQFGDPVSWFSVADGLLVGVDSANLLAGILFQNVRWTG